MSPITRRHPRWKVLQLFNKSGLVDIRIIIFCSVFGLFTADVQFNKHVIIPAHVYLNTYIHTLYSVHIESHYTFLPTHKITIVESGEVSGRNEKEKDYILSKKKHSNRLT